MWRTLLICSIAALLVGASEAGPADRTTLATSKLEAGRVELAAGRLDAAIAAFREAARLDPRNGATLNLLGSLLNQTGRYAQALRYAEAAVKVEPDNRRYRYNRGVVLAEHGRFAEAVTDFDSALAAHPDMAYAWLERGAALASLNRMPEARQSWSRARDVQPDLIWIDWYMATGDMIEGRYVEAEAGFDRVARRESGFVAAQIWRAVAQLRSGKAVSPSSGELGDWPGPVLSYFRGEINGNELLSVAARDRTSGDQRRVGEALYFIAQLEQSKGRIATAKAYLRKAAGKKAPRHVWKILAEIELGRVPFRQESRQPTAWTVPPRASPSSP